MRFFSNTTLENEVCRPKSGINLYPFGMEMPGRKWQGTSDKYRYSHNSHERQDAIFEGAQSAEYWMYDSRIGRRWERDPVMKTWESPYATFANNPIYYSDPLGLDPKGGGDGKGKGKGKGKGGSDLKKENEFKVKQPPSESLAERAKAAGITVDKMESKTTCLTCGESSPDAELRSASTSNGPIGNGQPAPDPTTPGAYTPGGNYPFSGLKIISTPNSNAELLSHYNFDGNFNIGAFGFKYNATENEISYEWSHKFPYGMAPKISAGTDGFSVGTNKFSTSTSGDNIDFWLFGKSYTVKQFAGINKSIQNVQVPLDFNYAPVFSVATSITVYSYIESTRWYGTMSMVNLKIQAQTFFDLGNMGILQTPVSQVKDTNFRRVRAEIPFGPKKVGLSAGIGN